MTCIDHQVHLILRHKSPKTGEIEEKHLSSPPTVESDKATHIYTAILKPDNTWVAKAYCTSSPTKCAMQLRRDRKRQRPHCVDHVGMLC